jgi:membrane protein YdbS with pleckstrin-like domain
MGIRVVPNETVPASIYRVLLPHERRVITVRFHPAVLIKPVALALAGLAVAGLLSTITHLDGAVLLVIWLAWLILLIRLLYRIYVWLEDYFVVTSQRLLLATGVLKKSVNMMPLTKVTDMRFERSATGRLLGYGTFIVESAVPRAALSRGVRADLQGPRHRGRLIHCLSTHSLAAMADPRAPAMSRSGTRVISAISACST